MYIYSMNSCAQVRLCLATSTNYLFISTQITCYFYHMITFPEQRQAFIEIQEHTLIQKKKYPPATNKKTSSHTKRM
jgi:hypothetical protein